MKVPAIKIIIANKKTTASSGSAKKPSPKPARFITVVSPHKANILVHSPTSPIQLPVYTLHMKHIPPMFGPKPPSHSGFC